MNPSIFIIINYLNHFDYYKINIKFVQFKINIDKYYETMIIME